MTLDRLPPDIQRGAHRDAPRRTGCVETVKKCIAMPTKTRAPGEDTPKPTNDSKVRTEIDGPSFTEPKEHSPRSMIDRAPPPCVVSGEIHLPGHRTISSLMIHSQTSKSIQRNSELRAILFTWPERETLMSFRWPIPRITMVCTDPACAYMQGRRN